MSDTSHPFADDECIVVGLTTQQHPESISVPDSAWVRGGSEKDAYISPWYLTAIKHRDLDHQQGTLSASLLSAAVDTLHRYTSPSTH